eukprot:175862_1
MVTNCYQDEFFILCSCQIQLCMVNNLIKLYIEHNIHLTNMDLEGFNVITVSVLFILGCQICAFASCLDLKQFMETLKKPKGIIIGIICQYVLMPALAFSISSIFSSDLLIEQRIAFLILSTMPG